MYDLIFLQELWLAPALMHKIQNFSSEYICYGVSAMEKAVSTGPLKGRPFGGTAILVRKSLGGAVRHASPFDRVVSVQICNCLFINVYMPCEDGAISNLNLLNEILANVSNIIERSDAEFLIFGGDLNVNIIDKATPHAVAIKDFLMTYKLIADCRACAPVTPTENNKNVPTHTFSNEMLGRYSTIDFICVSKNLKKHVAAYYTVDSALNHSDHIPVGLGLYIPSESEIIKYRTTGKIDKPNLSINEKSCRAKLRWDLCNIDNYYKATCDLLYPTYNKLCKFYSQTHTGTETPTRRSPNKVEGAKIIESLYNETVNSLNVAANACIPKLKSNTLKHWWNSELTVLKQRAINAHNMWTQAGSPKSGPLWEIRNKEKFNYKMAIKKEKKATVDLISDNLHESLVRKSSVDFWKTWKTKVCNKSSNTKVRIENNYSDNEAAEKFAAFFEGTCTPNSAQFDSDKKKELKEAMARYTADYQTANQSHFSAEIVGIAIARLSNGKSPGIDGLTTEHLVNCHPVIFSLLAKLFSCMLLYEYVPNNFGKGITIL